MENGPCYKKCVEYISMIIKYYGCFRLVKILVLTFGFGAWGNKKSPEFVFSELIMIGFVGFFSKTTVF